MTKERYAKGFEILKQTTGTSGADMMNELKKLDPDLERFVVEFCYGDILSRPGLDFKTRWLAIIAALTAVDRLYPHHVQGAFNLGCSETEIREIILQTIIFSGFPTGINAMKIAKEVFEKNK